MSIRLFKRQPPAEPAAATERPEVRQYRYLLGTADLDPLEGIHRESLAALDPLVRGHVLRTAQERLLSGRDLTVDDIAAIAHLVCVGEVGTPGILVSALTEAALERLAHFAVGRPSAIALLEGYGAWDGRDPDPQRATARLAALVGPPVAQHVASPETPPPFLPVAPQPAPTVARRTARQHA